MLSGERSGFMSGNIINIYLQVIERAGSIERRARWSDMRRDGRGKLGLTELEGSILSLAAQGAGNGAIAAELYVSRHTVKAHMSVILKKLNAQNRTHAAYIALKNNIIS